MKYIHVHKHTLDFEDENITDFTKIKKHGTLKSYMKSQHMIYMKTTRKIHTDFVASRGNVQCLISTFIRYKPLHHLWREKDSCLC